ncbi:hypothetical protein U9M48_014143 [Paspalum notatum var. saurae]|uniref:Uncharacterized protein n=1 Tax=Paspalum notatum var. saurae TaxID=547442 RepID=A0AAQ3T100_PASNO
MAGEDELVAGKGVPIRPPRLEDAGLEDCALPPESIAEAFSLAAAALSSRLTLSEDSDDEEGEERRVCPSRGGGCVDDAAPARGAVPDALVGGGGGGLTGAGGGADEVVVVGGRGGGCEDAVVVGGRAEEGDRVVVVGEGLGEKKLGKEGGCVDGVREGVVSEPRRAQGDGEDDEKKAAAEKAILNGELDMHRGMIVGVFVSTVYYNLKLNHPYLDIPPIEYDLVHLLVHPMPMLGVIFFQWT